jgi:hypothetical protein
MIEQKTLNRIRRVLAEIDANAKGANSQGRWHISHGNVINSIKDEKTGAYSYYDVASQPWEKRHTVYGLAPTAGNSYRDMRHVATCSPAIMIRLVEDVLAVLAELDKAKPTEHNGTCAYPDEN